MASLRYVIYLRKSSESEERQELSIPAQARELTELAARRSLKVIGQFDESQSAKEPGRPVFARVLSMVEHRQADGILCWKLDRLARNPVDGGRVMYSLGKKVIKEIVTPERVYVGSGDDKLLMSIIFGMATKYSDDLSDNVRRGNRQALIEGRWPGKPKIGYRRDKETMQLVPDPERYPAVAKLWTLLLSGRRPLDVLDIARRELGLATPSWGKTGGHLISKSELYRIFRSPFYAGVMVRTGQSYPGTHPAMVSLADFERAQTILDGKLRPLARPQHRFFTYGGLMRCGLCSAAVTPHAVVNRQGKPYTYYHCCRKERRYAYCPERATDERKLDTQFRDFFTQALPPENWIRALLERLADLETRDQTLSATSRLRLMERVEQIDRVMARQRDLVSREIITEEDFMRDNHVLVMERQGIKHTLTGDAVPSTLVKPHDEAIAALRQAESLFVNGTSEEKRALVSNMTCNLRLADQKLTVEAKKPIMMIGSWRRFPVLSAWLDQVETVSRQDVNGRAR